VRRGDYVRLRNVVIFVQAYLAHAVVKGGENMVQKPKEIFGAPPCTRAAPSTKPSVV
jgi:hypothetical protein